MTQEEIKGVEVEEKRIIEAEQQEDIAGVISLYTIATIIEDYWKGFLLEREKLDQEEFSTAIHGELDKIISYFDVQNESMKGKKIEKLNLIATNFEEWTTTRMCPTMVISQYWSPSSFSIEPYIIIKPHTSESQFEGLNQVLPTRLSHFDLKNKNDRKTVLETIKKTYFGIFDNVSEKNEIIQSIMKIPADRGFLSVFPVTTNKSRMCALYIVMENRLAKNEEHAFQNIANALYNPLIKKTFEKDLFNTLESEEGILVTLGGFSHIVGSYVVARASSIRDDQKRSKLLEYVKTRTALLKFLSFGVEASGSEHGVQTSKKDIAGEIRIFMKNKILLETLGFHENEFTYILELEKFEINNCIEGIIELLLENLIRNVAKYAYRNDEESIKITIRLKANSDKKSCTIEFWDNGLGFTKTVMENATEKIIDPDKLNEMKVKCKREEKSGRLIPEGFGVRSLYYSIHRIGGEVKFSFANRSEEIHKGLKCEVILPKTWNVRGGGSNG